MGLIPIFNPIFNPVTSKFFKSESGVYLPEEKKKKEEKKPKHVKQYGRRYFSERAAAKKRWEDSQKELAEKALSGDELAKHELLYGDDSELWLERKNETS